MSIQEGDLSDERIERMIENLYVLPASKKIVTMDRDEVLALIREVKRFRAEQNPWDRQRAQERCDLKEAGYT